MKHLQTRINNTCSRIGVTEKTLSKMSDKELLGMQDFGVACLRYLRGKFPRGPLITSEDIKYLKKYSSEQLMEEIKRRNQRARK